jgi:Holliday junction resolvase-like predicted endonuclease
VLVEVRFRRAHVFDAWRSLAGGKRERFTRAAREAQEALRVPFGTPVRLDVVLVSAEGAFTHVRGALPPRPTYDP